jgi:vacuolar-type H+-ATPase subunit B/Vma2
LVEARTARLAIRRPDRVQRLAIVALAAAKARQGGQTGAAEQVARLGAGLGIHHEQADFLSSSHLSKKRGGKLS